MTDTKFPSPSPLKRVAILGTAASHVLTPWQDHSLEKWGLNDAYMLGYPTAHRWYDLHAFHQMAFRPKGDKVVRADQIPVGSYVRPADHLDWLKSRPFPVYLQESRPDWPNARVFPKQQILDTFAKFWPWRLTRRGEVLPGRDYEASSPAWMLMHAIVEGYQEIHVYGIHLATEWEYVQQRPNFEWLLGVAAGMGVKVVLPQMAPIAKGTFQYAYEPKADVSLQALQIEIQQIKQEGLTLRQQLAACKWYETGRKKDLDARLRVLDVDLADAKGRVNRQQLAMRVA
jgi:hypothetical protein